MYVYVKLIRFYCDNITIETFGRARQIGQVSWERSHRSMHSTWNSCPHNPSFLHSSPSSNELKHTTHSNQENKLSARKGSLVGGVRRIKKGLQYVIL
ncbi:hypothetical protein ACP275_14G072600 [Erythranthe tilingii]